MKAQTPFTFAVLRYVHDVATGEFANVGLLLHAPEAGFLGARCVSTYGRLSHFFGAVDGEHVKQVLAHISSRVAELESQARQGDLFRMDVRDARAWASEVLPPDDSSLQFAPLGNGLTRDAAATLDQLFERYVERYAHRVRPATRADEDVWPAFREALRTRHVLTELRSKVIAAPDYQHEFRHAWKNGIWNAAEAISFDMADAGDILEKANKWLGRAVNLNESPERFKLYLLLGAPHEQSLRRVYGSAQSILNKMPCAHELIPEEQAAEFAERVEADVQSHEPSA